MHGWSQLQWRRDCWRTWGSSLHLGRRTAWNHSIASSSDMPPSLLHSVLRWCVQGVFHLGNILPIFNTEVHPSSWLHPQSAWTLEMLLHASQDAACSFAPEWKCRPWADGYKEWCAKVEKEGAPCKEGIRNCLPSKEQRQLEYVVFWELFAKHMTLLFLFLFSDYVSELMTEMLQECSSCSSLRKAEHEWSSASSSHQPLAAIQLNQPRQSKSDLIIARQSLFSKNSDIGGTQPCVTEEQDS